MTVSVKGVGAARLRVLKSDCRVVFVDRGGLPRRKSPARGRLPIGGSGSTTRSGSRSAGQASSNEASVRPSRAYRKDMITAWWVNNQIRVFVVIPHAAGPPEQTSDPQHDVRPTLPAGRLIVELFDFSSSAARPPQAGGASPAAGESVERAKMALHATARRDDLDARGATGDTRITRRKGELSTTVGRRSSGARAIHAPTAPGCCTAEIRQLNVSITLPQIKLLSLRLARLVVREVPDALTVSDQRDDRWSSQPSWGCRPASGPRLRRGRISAAPSSVRALRPPVRTRTPSADRKRQVPGFSGARLERCGSTSSSVMSSG